TLLRDGDSGGSTEALRLYSREYIFAAWCYNFAVHSKGGAVDQTFDAPRLLLGAAPQQRGCSVVALNSLCSTGKQTQPPLGHALIGAGQTNNSREAWTLVSRQH